jgi:hypothetical protein
LARILHGSGLARILHGSGLAWFLHMQVVCQAGKKLGMKLAIYTLYKRRKERAGMAIAIARNMPARKAYAKNMPEKTPGRS